MPSRKIATSSSHSSQQLLKLVPGFSLFVLTILSMVNLPTPGFSAIPPAFHLMAIYFFVSWQPRYLPIWVIFACGLIYDAFQTSLFGTYALLFLIFRFAVLRFRYHTGYIEKLMHHSLWFIVFATGFFLVEWAIVSMELGFNVMTSILIKRDLLTLLVYPLLHLILSFMIASIQSRSYKS